MPLLAIQAASLLGILRANVLQRSKVIWAQASRRFRMREALVEVSLVLSHLFRMAQRFST